MAETHDTRNLLKDHARRLFWSKGFSNVSVREIATAAGVDVALIARYFGSKLGLFEATLDTLKKINPDDFQTTDSLVELFVEMFANASEEDFEESYNFCIIDNCDPSLNYSLIMKQVEKWT